MATITTRSGKGSPLTNTEVDDNFTNLNTAKYESGDNVSLGTGAFSGGVPTGGALVDHIQVGSTSGSGLKISTGSLFQNDDAVLFDAASTLAGQLIFRTGGTSRLVIDNNGTLTHNRAAVFNEDGADADFRVESDTVSSALFVDGETGRVGLGSSSPANVLELGSATNNRGISWGHTSSNYTNIWAKYSNGNLVLATGVAPLGSTTGYGVSFQSPNLSHSAVEIGAFANHGTFKFSSKTPQNQAVGTSISLLERFRADTSGFVINEPAEDYDFRVETANFSHTLFVESSSAYVGIRTSTPDYALDVNGTIRSSYHVATVIGSMGFDYQNTGCYFIFAEREKAGEEIKLQGRFIMDRGTSAAFPRLGYIDVVIDDTTSANPAIWYSPEAGGYTGSEDTFTLAKVTYNGTKYWAFSVPSGTAYHANDVMFEGYVRRGSLLPNSINNDKDADDPLLTVNDEVSPAKFIRNDNTTFHKGPQWFKSTVNLGSNPSNPGVLNIYDTSTTAYTMQITSSGTRGYKFEGSSSSGDYNLSMVNAGTGAFNLLVDGNMTVNDTGEAYDFRVETPSYANAFLVDGSENRVSITAPYTQLAGGVVVNNLGSTTGHLEFQTAMNQSTNDYVRANIVFSRNEKQIYWDSATNEWVHAGGSSADWTMLAHSAGEFRMFHGPSYATETRWTHADFKNDFQVMQMQNANGWTFDTPQGGSFIFNARGLNRDFQVQSDTHAHAFFLDAENSRIGMWNSAPTYGLDVLNTGRFQNTLYLGNASTGAGDLQVFDTGNNALQIAGVASNSFRMDMVGTSAVGNLEIRDLQLNLNAGTATSGVAMTIGVNDTVTKDLIFDEAPGSYTQGSYGARISYDADQNYLFLGRTNGTASAVDRALKLSRDTGGLTIGGADTGTGMHHSYGLRSYKHIDLNGADLIYNSGDARIAELGSGTYGLNFLTYNASDNALRTKLVIDDARDAPAIGYHRGQATWYQAQGPWALRGGKWNRVAYIDHRRAYELIIGTHGGWFGPGHICMHMSINYSGAAFGLQTISAYNNYVTQVRFTCASNGSGGGYLDIFVSSSYDQNGPSFHIRPLDGGGYTFVASQTLDPSTLTYTQTTNV